MGIAEGAGEGLEVVSWKVGDGVVGELLVEGLEDGKLEGRLEALGDWEGSMVVGESVVGDGVVGSRVGKAEGRAVGA